MNEKDNNTVDIQRALQDPQRMFAGPEEVLNHPNLNDADRIKILQHWAYDVRDVEVAEEEGMPSSNEEDLLTRILKALAELGANPEQPGSRSSAKQGGV